MAQLDLEDVGLTDRYNRNRANENFRKIQDGFNVLQQNLKSLETTHTADVKEILDKIDDLKRTLEAQHIIGPTAITQADRNFQDPYQGKEW